MQHDTTTYNKVVKRCKLFLHNKCCTLLYEKLGSFDRGLRLRLHGAIYRPNSFVLMLSCANLKAVRYESTSLNRIVADKSHRVIVA